MTTPHRPGCYYRANPGAAAQREYEHARLRLRGATANFTCDCLEESAMTTHVEPTRTRQHGTRVTQSQTPEERIAAIRQIVTEHQYAKVDGVMVDGFSASAIIAVYDALNPANQAKFAALPIAKMASVAFKLVK